MAMARYRKHAKGVQRRDKTTRERLAIIVIHTTKEVKSMGNSNKVPPTQNKTPEVPEEEVIEDGTESDTKVKKEK